MAKKSPRRAQEKGGLYLVVENEDWVAMSGTAVELEQLGLLLIEFAQGKGPDFLNLDSPSPLFRTGSLGISLYRTE